MTALETSINDALIERPLSARELATALEWPIVYVRQALTRMERKLEIEQLPGGTKWSVRRTQRQRITFGPPR